jgi:structural maintenance of chromosome 4
LREVPETVDEKEGDVPEHVPPVKKLRPSPNELKEEKEVEEVRPKERKTSVVPQALETHSDSAEEDEVVAAAIKGDEEQDSDVLPDEGEKSLLDEVPMPPASQSQVVSEEPKGPKSRLVIHKMALVNFKSYAGRQEIGPFHKVNIHSTRLNS